MALAKKSLKNLNLLSVYRLILFSLIGIFFNSSHIYLLLFIIVFIINKKESLFYVLLILILFLYNNISYDYIKYGVVERKINNYYVIDKVLYKTNIYDEDICVGDIVYTLDSKNIEDKNLLKKNIKYTNTDYNKISNIIIKYKIYNKINNLDEDLKTILDKLIYNVNNYNDFSYNIGFGLAIYYLIKIINKKNRKVALIFLIIYSILFYFDVKFYLLLVDILINDRNYRFIFKLFFIGILNINLFYNYSILIPLLLGLYNFINFKIHFKTYMFIIYSILFGYVNIFSLFFYKYVIYIEIIEFIICLFSIFINKLSIISIFIADILSRFNVIDISIRGEISVISLLIFYILKNTIRYKNDFIYISILCFLLISPINNPLFHISFIDVGQGDSILIKLPFNVSNILIDTGSKYNYYKLKENLYKEGIYKINYLIITHDDSDHNGNIEQLSKDFNVKEIITYGQNIERGNFKLEYLYIDKFDNDNDNSLVYWTKINNLGFLFTGDISYNAEKLYINKYKQYDVDVLKVSHHGSKTSSSKYFISNLLPRFAVISTSGQYNHPSLETLDVLDKYMVDYHITKNEGDIKYFFFLGFTIMKNDNREFVIIM